MYQTLTRSELRNISIDSLEENGFAVNFPSEVMAELEQAAKRTLPNDPSIKDLRNLLWSSIDNESSKDLDQIEYAEELPNGDIRLLIGVADVDEFVEKGSEIDKFARGQTVTVYTEAKVLPMLPREISEGLTSLLEGEDRLAIVAEMLITPDGDVPRATFYRALTHNYAKLTYEEVGEWLDGRVDWPEAFGRIKGLKEQVALQQKAAERLIGFRQKRGSLEFESIEAIPVFDGEKPKDLKITQTNSARKVIENFMVAANVEIAEFLESKGLASIRRIVKTPARWERIREIAKEYGKSLPSGPDPAALSDFLNERKAAAPERFPDLSLSIVKLIGAGEYAVERPGEEAEGHFGLAVKDYTHSTGPNRRYPDLVIQRALKAALRGDSPPYSDEELGAIAEKCNERERAARKVERKMRKVVAASVMQDRIGERFEAIVTGITPSGTFARILRPPVDGRIERGERGLEVGQKVDVSLISVNIHSGFIDFARE